MAINASTNPAVQVNPQTVTQPFQATPVAANTSQEITVSTLAEPNMVSLSQPADIESKQQVSSVQKLRSLAMERRLEPERTFPTNSAIGVPSGGTFQLAGQMIAQSQQAQITEPNASTPPLAPSGTNPARTGQTGAVEALLVQSVTRGSFPLFNQNDVANDPNACGPTGLAMVLAAEGLIPATIDAARQLDRDTRIGGLGVGASDLVTAAEARGLQASAINNSSTNEMRQALERGNRVMAMIDNNGTPHWINILEMRPSGEGGDTMVYADPATGTIKEMGRSEFESKWDNPMQGNGRFVSTLTGYQNMMVAFDKDESSLPPERLGASMGFDTVADLVSDIYQEFGDLRDGNPRNSLRRAVQLPYRGLPGVGLPGPGLDLPGSGFGLPIPNLPPPPAPPNPFRLPNPFKW